MVSIWWRFSRGSRATSLCTESEWAGEVKDRFTQHLSSSYSSYIRGPGRRRSRPASPCCPLRLVSWSYLVKSWSLRAGFTRIYLTPFGFIPPSCIRFPRPYGVEALYIWPGHRVCLRYLYGRDEDWRRFTTKIWAQFNSHQEIFIFIFGIRIVFKFRGTLSSSWLFTD